MLLLPAERPEAGWATVLAGATLLFVFAVITASAYIRIGSANVPSVSAATIDAARTIRESAGSVAALGIATLAIASATLRATRASLGAAAGAALALTIALSVVGWLTGIEPPRWAAYANQFGGVLLAGVLGWLMGRAAARIEAADHDRRLAGVALIFIILQAGFGGAIATSTREPAIALWIFHAAVGLAAACCAAALAVRLDGPNDRALRAALAACAMTTPLIGLVSTLLSIPVPLQVAHALSAAALLACIAFALGRLRPLA